MAAKNERTYYARVDEVLRLMKKKGYSLDALAKAAIVSRVTLGRLLNREKKKRKPAFAATFKKIADKLGVAPDTLMVGYTPETDPTLAHDYRRIQPALDLAKAFDAFDETVELKALMAKVKKIVGAKATIYVIAISPGDSVIIQVSVEMEDFDRLMFHALLGDLATIGITSVIVPKNNAIVAAVLSKHAPGVSPAANDNQFIRFTEKAG